jgi:hypothetical protein
MLQVPPRAVRRFPRDAHNLPYQQLPSSTDLPRLPYCPDIDAYAFIVPTKQLPSRTLRTSLLFASPRVRSDQLPTSILEA